MVVLLSSKLLPAYIIKKKSLYRCAEVVRKRNLDFVTRHTPTTLIHSERRSRDTYGRCDIITGFPAPQLPQPSTYLDVCRHVFTSPLFDILIIQHNTARVNTIRDIFS